MFILICSLVLKPLRLSRFNLNKAWCKTVVCDERVSVIADN